MDSHRYHLTLISFSDVKEGSCNWMQKKQKTYQPAEECKTDEKKEIWM